jgi:heme exporter protein A
LPGGECAYTINRAIDGSASLNAPGGLRALIATLNISNLAIERGTRRLFAGFNLALSAGEAAALTGPNGAGKTSLLRAVAGFIRAAEGEIAFAGDGGAALEPEEARSRATHYLGHLDALKTSRTARDELLFQARWTGGSTATALAAAETLRLTPLLDLDVRKLSAGQRRRLALARLVAARRYLWLLDEPLAPLDAAHRALAGELMAAHLAAGGLIVAATHDALPIPARAAPVGVVA